MARIGTRRRFPVKRPRLSTGHGRPKTGIGKTIGLRLYPEEEAALEAWIAQQPDPKPSKPEAIRRIIRDALMES